MGGSDDQSARQPPEALQFGSSRPLLSQEVPARWRPSVMAFLALLIGVVLGAGAVLGWQARPSPPPSAERSGQQPGWFDEHDVELILLDAARPQTRSRGANTEVSPLEVDSAFFLSGAVASTVLEVAASDRSLDVRAPALPVTVSPAGRYQPVVLQVVVRDCEAATRWTPVDRPFTVTWRDEHGVEHLDRAGYFDRAMATSLTRYVDAVCG